MLSNGAFELLDINDKVIFEFSNDMQQAFTIDYIASENSTDNYHPGSVIAQGTYQQIDSANAGLITRRWIKSTGTDISDMELTAVNCNKPSPLGKAQDLGGEYLHFSINTTGSEVGKPASIYLGGVLILYIAVIT